MSEGILITGGAGFIGSKTANYLSQLGYKVKILDNLNRQIHKSKELSLSKLAQDINFVYGDIRDSKLINEVLQKTDIIYHFAAETGVGQSMYEQERYIDVNVRGTSVLCDCILRLQKKPKLLILSSSRAVYGEGPYLCHDCGIVYPEQRAMKDLIIGRWDLSCPLCHKTSIEPIPSSEKSTVNPTSIYGYTKKAQEDLFRFLHLSTNIPIIIFRYFNVFGPGQSLSNPYTGILSIFTSQMLTNDQVELYEDGQMRRDFIFIDQIVKSNISVLNQKLNGISTLNVASGKSISIETIARILKEETGYSKEIKVSGRYRFGDIRHSWAEISEYKKIIGSFHEKDLRRNLKKLVDWARNENPNLDLRQSHNEIVNSGFGGIAK